MPRARVAATCQPARPSTAHRIEHFQLQQDHLLAKLLSQWFSSPPLLTFSHSWSNKAAISSWFDLLDSLSLSASTMSPLRFQTPLDLGTTSSRSRSTSAKIRIPKGFPSHDPPVLELYWSAPHPDSDTVTQHDFHTCAGRIRGGNAEQRVEGWVLVAVVPCLACVCLGACLLDEPIDCWYYLLEEGLT